MSRLRAEQGFTLVELQIVLVLMIGVLGATLVTFNESEANWRINQEQVDAQEQNRRVIDTIVKQLRNLASPSTQNPMAVERREPDDIVFQTVAPTKPGGSANDRNISRVRYCLGQPVGGVQTLWRQEQTWVSPAPPAALPAGTACPAATWPALPGTSQRARAVANDIVNDADAGEPVFEYDSTDLSQIYSVGVTLIVDADPLREPLETKLSSSVFLRNQNQAPVSAPTVTPTGTGHTVVLNGSASYDPEGRALASYEWFVDGDTDESVSPNVVANWSPTGSTWPQTHEITLRVTDVGGRTAETTVEVTIN